MLNYLCFRYAGYVRTTFDTFYEWYVNSWPSSTSELPSPKSLGAVPPAGCPVLTCYDKCSSRCNAAKHAEWEI